MRCDIIFISKWSHTLYQLSQELGKTVHVVPHMHIVKTLNLLLFCSFERLLWCLWKSENNTI